MKTKLPVQHDKEERKEEVDIQRYNIQMLPCGKLSYLGGQLDLFVLWYQFLVVLSLPSLPSSLHKTKQKRKLTFTSPRVNNVLFPTLPTQPTEESIQKEINHLFLLDFQVNRGFQGNLFAQVVRALRGFLGHLGVRGDRGDQESCCGIQKEPGSAKFQSWPSELKEKKK